MAVFSANSFGCVVVPDCLLAGFVRYAYSSLVVSSRLSGIAFHFCLAVRGGPVASCCTFSVYIWTVSPAFQAGVLCHVDWLAGRGTRCGGDRGNLLPPRLPACLAFGPSLVGGLSGIFRFCFDSSFPFLKAYSPLSYKVF